MPIEITHVESGVYLNRWIGHVTLDDIQQSELEGTKLLRSDEPQVVLVNDLSDVTKLPLDLKALRRVVEKNPQVIALLVVDAPPIVRLAGEAQARTVTWYIEFFETLDAAYERARALLANTNG
jgi:hypothetical protein